jgi:large subunit ribosomal protein L7/L12
MNEQHWPLDIQEIGDHIAGLSVTQAVQLVKYLEEVHGVKAAAVPVVLPDYVKDNNPSEPRPVPTEFNVILESYEMAKKIGLIRTLRECTGLGIKEARDFLDGLPKVVKGSLLSADAEKLKTQLEAAGATVLVKPIA